MVREDLMNMDNCSKTSEINTLCLCVLSGRISMKFLSMRESGPRACLESGRNIEDEALFAVSADSCHWGLGLKTRFVSTNRRAITPASSALNLLGRLEGAGVALWSG